MVEIRQTAIAVLLAGCLLEVSVGGPPCRFYPDDPISSMPKPLSVGKVQKQDVNDIFDFLNQTKSPKSRKATPARDVNTLGEVPDSEWFTNRHSVRRLTRDELQRGFDGPDTPQAPYTVTGTKTEGVTSGFRMTDSRGRKYFVKADPIASPELATSADVIVSRILYAVGYNVPQNDIVQMKLSDMRLSDKAKLTVEGNSRPMTWKDVEGIVKQIPHYPDGSFRVIASLAIEGEPVGPFRFQDVRRDDPNDTIPHEDRRELRGLKLLSAWFNNTDARANNTLDTVVEENGTRFVRHHLLDFGSALGSDGTSSKEVRLGNRFIAPTLPEATRRVVTLGMVPEEWERVKYPHLRGIGTFEAQSFRPDQWKSDYPNPAFLASLTDDDFWAAKQIMAFTDDDLRAIVETARFTESQATEYMIRTLALRRDKIGQSEFSKLLPFDHFQVVHSDLVFDDLSVQYRFHAARTIEATWFRFDNTTGQREPVSADSSIHLPFRPSDITAPAFLCVEIRAVSDPLQAISVYLRKETGSYKVVGIDRM